MDSGYPAGPNLRVELIDGPENCGYVCKTNRCKCSNAGHLYGTFAFNGKKGLPDAVFGEWKNAPLP